MRLPYALARTLILSAWLPAALAQPMGPPWTQQPGSGSSSGEAPMGAGTGLSMGGSMSPELRSRMEQHMQAMQDLRMRMATATTPEQRQSLMNEHLRLMDQNMSLMQQMMMGSGGTLPGPGTPESTAPAPAGSTAPGSAAPTGSPGSVR